MRSNWQTKGVLLLIVLLAFALRLGPAFDNRFHPDEALFSSWALKIAHGENVLLTGVPVDKPPLLIYLTAISFFFFGQTEIAARLPNIAASVISVALIYQLAVGQPGIGQLGTGQLGIDPLGIGRSGTDPQLPNQPVARLTILPPLLLALSPFAILFAPTAFLDPTMIMFGLAALVTASRGRTGWAGILLGLSFATKVQGLFFAPLMAVFFLPRKRQAAQQAGWLRDCVVTFLTFALVALIVIVWDRLRGGLPFWVQQTINYGGIRVIYPGEVWPRLSGWLALLPYFFGPLIGLLALIGLPILLQYDLTHAARTRAAFIDLILLAYLVGLFALHWLLAFPVWDRYLLILVPFAALLVGRAIGRLVNWSISRIVNWSMGQPLHRAVVHPPDARMVAPGQPHSQDGAGQVSVISSSCHLVSLSLILMATLPYGVTAAQSQYPIGGDHGAYDGIDQVAAYLSTLPSGTVVYDHWLAWELDYYLGEGHVYIAYFDTPAAMADDLRVFDRGDDRYVIFPARESPDKVVDAIGQEGFSLTPIFLTQNRFGQTSFTVFKISRSVDSSTW